MKKLYYLELALITLGTAASLILVIKQPMGWWRIFPFTIAVSLTALALEQVRMRHSKKAHIKRSGTMEELWPNQECLLHGHIWDAEQDGSNRARCTRCGFSRKIRGSEP